jgi:hypothetical protein
MKGRSLWSALMLAWLSATSTPSPPDEPIISPVSVADHETSGETAAVIDTDACDAVAGAQAADSSTEAGKAP